MAELEGRDFPTFFEAVYGYLPFNWQVELADRVVDGRGWPEAVDVPTGMGKTAVLDIAVFALAVQSALPAANRTTPTRTFMVVDRRLIVDQTYERACRLRRALSEDNDRVVRQVASALQDLAGSDGSPLEVVRMRGGTTWTSRWLRSPDQPAVVVGTVDQYGSRALFRGYGVSDHFRPIDAALTGTDSLLVLDEAHISRALFHTIDAVHRYEGVARRPVLSHRRPKPVRLSATLPPETTDVFQPDLTNEASPEARARLDAAKRTTLVDVEARGKDPSPALAVALAAVALDRASDGEADRIGVVCNTVRLARAVFERVCEQANGTVDTALLIGRCREFDRAELAVIWNKELDATADREPRVRPVVVVATQTIEVGADFDLDVLITEVASLDALVQRLGRLNRLGRRPSADAVIVRSASRHDDDPVYGATAAKAWDWLAEVAGLPSPVPPKAAAGAARSGPTVDLGALALKQWLTPERRAALAPPAPLVAEVIGPTLAGWACTSPAPEPDQPVHPYLHGVDRGLPEVNVCWRAGLPDPSAPGGREQWEAEIRATPVHAEECVSVPIWAAKRFCAGLPPSDMSDLEGEMEDDPFEEALPVAALIVAPDGSARWGAEHLRPGATVVVASERGGHDGWGWTGRPDDNVVVDVADLCRRRRGLRLRPTLLAHLLGGRAEDWAGIVPVPGAAFDELSVSDPLDETLQAIGRVPDSASPVAYRIREVAADLQEDSDRRTAPTGTWYVVTSGRGLPDHAGDAGPEASSALTRRVGLDEHSIDVAVRSRDIATRLGLPLELVRSVELAGEAHDLGKADPRFQVMLHAGDRLRAEAWPELLAKSGMDAADRTAFRRARIASGLPSGMRHESVSASLLARMAEREPELAGGVDLDLVLHLVASHHGRSRPLLPPVVDDAPVDVCASLPTRGVEANVPSNEGLVDWDHPARFRRLGDRYGWWGLALLETVVRLADIRCSEQYEAATS